MFFYLPFIFFFTVFLILCFIDFPGIKGRFGEKKVTLILSELPKDKYIVLNDLLLYTSRGSSQIDHVVFSVYGIFVIETKNYSGWIYGSANAEKWTKNMYGRKYLFRNPLKQNYAHIKALQEVLGIINKECFISIVTFSNAATIKFRNSNNVVNFRHLISCIYNYNDEIFSIDECFNLYKKVENRTSYTKEEKKEHIKKIKEIQRRRKV